MVKRYQKKMHVGWISPSMSLYKDVRWSCRELFCVFVWARGQLLPCGWSVVLWQYCGGASCGRRGAGAAARGFDPRQREQRCSGGGGGRHSYLDHLVTLDESDQSLEMLKGRLSLPLLTQKTPLQLQCISVEHRFKIVWQSNVRHSF